MTKCATKHCTNEADSRGTLCNSCFAEQFKLTNTTCTKCGDACKAKKITIDSGTPILCQPCLAKTKPTARGSIDTDKKSVKPKTKYNKHEPQDASSSPASASASASSATPTLPSDDDVRIMLQKFADRKVAQRIQDSRSQTPDSKFTELDVRAKFSVLEDRLNAQEKFIVELREDNTRLMHMVAEMFATLDSMTSAD